MLNLVSDTMAACEHLLFKGEVDFLLCHHHPVARWVFSSDRFTSMVVGTDLLVPVTAPDASGSARWKILGIASKPTRCLGYSAPSGIGRILDAVDRSSGNGISGDIVFTSPMAAALQTMARQGQGAAWLPLSLAKEDLASGALVEAGGDQYSMPVEIRLFRSLRQQSAVAEQFWSKISSHGSIGRS